MDYISIDNFEGPLDLLLHLVKESNIDILDIKIEEITDKYLNYINHEKELNIDIKAAVAVIEKGEGKKLVEKETGIPIFSVVKLDVIDGKVVIEKTIED